MISVVIPTIKGREDHFERCHAAYEKTLRREKYEILVYRNYKTCGQVWRIGGTEAQGDYIHFTADDLIPIGGWHIAAMRSCNRGDIPAPRIFRPDNSLESCGNWEEDMPEGAIPQYTRIPFLSRQQHEAIGPSLTTHYYTDNWISYRGRVCGYETRVVHDYTFVHHHAQPGRGAGMTENQRMQHDAAKYQMAVEEDQQR